MAKELIIKSPVGFDPAIYYWPNENQDNNGASEIIETIKCVYEDFPELNALFSKERLHDYDSKSYESMRLLCELYNEAIDKILDNNPSIHSRIPKKPSIVLVKHIIHQAYNQAVTDPDKLNDYEPFSPEVYGETSFEFVRQMTEEIRIKNEDVFIDLGSGVGQVVLQVAALTNVKLCIGIEKAEVPASYSVGMSDAFKFWMNWYGKQFAEYHLMKGDFFSEKYRDTINNGTFIFVNNFAFGPEVDHNLKLRFAELKDGARIVSSKAFCPLNFRITDRTLSDIGSIMRVEEIQPKEKGSVSWTGKPVSYYLHEIDRRKLEEYFNSKTPKTNKTNESEMTRNRRSSSKSHQFTNNHHSTADQSSNDSSKFNNKDDSPVYGPTTRKAWSEWCKTATIAPSASSKSDERGRDAAVQNGNHKKPSSVTNSLLDADKLMTSDSDTCDTLIESDSNNNNSTSKNDKQAPKRTRKNANEKRLSSTRTSERTLATSNGNSETSTDSRRTPRQPKKPKANDKTKKYSDCLDLLHERTMLSISTTAAIDLPIGCINDELSSYDASERDNRLDPRNENIENVQDAPNSTTDNQAGRPAEPKRPNILYNLNLDSLVCNFRNQVVSFLEHMRQDEYRTSILDAIEKEKRLKSELTTRIGKIENQISEQLGKGSKLLEARLAEIDIHTTDPDMLGVKAKEIINQNRELHTKIDQMNDANQQLEEMLRNKLSQIHLANKLETSKKMNDYKQAIGVNGAHDNHLNNNGGLNNFKNLNSSNLNSSLSTTANSGSKVNSSRAKKSSSSKQSLKDANSHANNHQTNKNSHLNSQRNPMAQYGGQPENPNLSKAANPLNLFGQATVNSQAPNYFSNQSLSNLNNFGNLTSQLSNLSALNSANLHGLNNGLNVALNYDGKSNLSNSLHNKANALTPSLSQTSLSSQSSLSQSSLANSGMPPVANHSLTGGGGVNSSGNSKPAPKHLDRIKEKVAKSKCNNGNNVLKNDTNLPTNNLTTNSNHHANPLKTGTSRKEAAKINGTTHQFPELEEDVIKSMIVAAFHEEPEGGNSLNNSTNHGNLNNLNSSISSSISNSINNTINSVINSAAAEAAAAETAGVETVAPVVTKTPKPRKPRQPRAKKESAVAAAAAAMNTSNGPVVNSFDAISKQTQSKTGLPNSQSALPYEPPTATSFTSTSASDFSSLFKNLHSASTITSPNSFFSAKKSSASLSSTPSSLASSSAANEPESTQGNAIKLTLKKIDRGRDSYTLVKSPESPERSVANCSNTDHHPKRKGGGSHDSPDHKSKKSKSPKYSSSLNAYEPEKQRLILKLTNRN